VHDHVETAVHVDELGDVLVVEVEVRPREQVLDVAQVPGNQVVHADHLESLLEEAIAEVTTEESGSAGDQGAGFGHVVGVVAKRFGEAGGGKTTRREDAVRSRGTDTTRRRERSVLGRPLIGTIPRSHYHGRGPVCLQGSQQDLLPRIETNP